MDGAGPFTRCAVRLAPMHRTLRARLDLAVAQQFGAGARRRALVKVKQDRRRSDGCELTGQNRCGQDDEAVAKSVHGVAAVEVTEGNPCCQIVRRAMPSWNPGAAPVRNRYGTSGRL